jgi:hypothetical protein
MTRACIGGFMRVVTEVCSAEWQRAAVQTAALWALRNFGLVEMYRSRMAGMGVVALCLRVLEEPAAGSGAQHAAVALLQMLSSADAENVKIITEAQALPKLVSLLYGKHRHASVPAQRNASCMSGELLRQQAIIWCGRIFKDLLLIVHHPCNWCSARQSCTGCRGIKVAALAALANLAVLDENKATAARLRVVPRLVTLLDRAAPADVVAMAAAALAQLVLRDANRLKCWRSGGVEKLKAIADRKLPRVSEVRHAAQARAPFAKVSVLSVWRCTISLCVIFRDLRKWS